MHFAGDLLRFRVFILDVGGFNNNVLLIFHRNFALTGVIILNWIVWKTEISAESKAAIQMGCAIKLITVD